jgi:hypothetical protein
MCIYTVSLGMTAQADIYSVKGVPVRYVNRMGSGSDVLELIYRLIELGR